MTRELIVTIIKLSYHSIHDKKIMPFSFTTADLCLSESPECHENLVEPAAKETQPKE
jgi:hypothetical protein